MFTKASALALAIGGVSTFAQAADDLIISEYVEGSSNNKAVEFYNPTGAAIDLSQYQLEFYFNGSTSAGSTIALSGSLAAGKTYVVADNDAAGEILAVANQLSTASFFNGDDTLVLRKQGQVIDSLGQLGTDPGSEWGSGDLSTQNNTLRRDPNQLIADTQLDDAVTLATWTGHVQDDFSDLGQFAGQGPTDPTDPTDPTEPPVSLVCHDPATKISALQGSSDISPLNGQSVTVEAIVTSNQEAGLKGLFLQMADAEVDGDINTSEGVFVYTGGSLGYQTGDRVRLTATVKEYNGLTELTNVSEHALCDSAQALPSAAEVSLPLAQSSDLEAVEGMRVHFTQNLVVNEVYNLGRYGEILLGSKRHFIGTQVAEPGSDALAVSQANALDSVLLDDGLTSQNPDPVRYPAPGLSADNTVRVGDSITGLHAVMHYGFGKYRLMPIDTVNFVATNPRSSEPALAAGGNLKVASFNVLNYFNGDGQGGGFPTARGADTPSEFARQRAKIISAMVSIDADIFGLMEIENDGFGSESAINDLVSGLNQAVGETRYQFISAPTPTIGTDAITVGMLYRSDRVTPVGAAKVLSSANSPLDEQGEVLFNDGKNRPSLTQAFEVLGEDQQLVVAVNHLKSKGSDCVSLGDPDLNDGQGNCNLTRTRAATALGTWLASEYGELPTLVIGDMNAYAKEDPIDALRGAGYLELFDHLGKSGAYSYVFSGETGQLDHALANTQLADRVVDVAEWHINTDEPRLLDYNEEFKSAGQIESLYSSDAYRSSDHDPVVISLLLERETIAPVASFSYELQGRTLSLVSSATDEDGEIVDYQWDLGNGETASGKQLSYRYAKAGEYPVTLTVTDNDGLSHSVTQVVKVQVKQQKPVAVIEHLDLWFMDLFISLSYDADGGIVSQSWKFNNGSKQTGPVAISFGHRASKVKLTVEDNDGLKGKAKLNF
ncbi:ExeM/NucH family extracellular endonuclease [Shewanella sp. KCT]|uniref:ExeM/NucH family extracellular endonuclease n=1 Tax=Shewanella sp. KCT TaxID=2569535 RepID=UPI001182F67F|nr:ExeM/NucH family extracellular endonuclease [Shewanella sp. KCT]TVP12788.1 endonuclease/exonuclease/phosphatase [Shewanella sp. KCT]